MGIKPMNIIQKIFTTNNGQTVGEPTRYEEERQKYIKLRHDAMESARKKLEEVLEQSFKGDCAILNWKCREISGDYLILKNSIKNPLNITFELSFDMGCLKGDEEK